MVKKLTPWLSVFLLLQVAFLRSQTYNNLNPRAKTVIDSTYNALIKKYKVAGAAIAIVDSGKIVYTMGYGFSDRENKIPATDKTIFRIGSCTKSFTSLSILQLQEKGSLSISESIRKYIPELSIQNRYNDDNQFFINDMMCHLSGLPCDVVNGFFCDSPPDINWLIGELNKQTTISPRRYKRAYSNVAYGLLGELIARRSGISYNEYLKENIFKPLGMNSTYVVPEGEQAKEFSKAYCFNKPINEPLIRDAAAGLIHSNVLDMSNYLLMFLNRGGLNGNKIISPVSLDDMAANHVEDAFLKDSENWGYGLYSQKLKVIKNKDTTIATITGHGGDTYAFHADFAYIPALNIGMVVLTNTDDGVRINSAEKLAKLYMKHAKGTTLDFSYADPALKEKKTSDVKETTCTNEEKFGVYNTGEMLIKVNNAQKIKFKQGPAKIVLKSKPGDTVRYSIKAFLFGVVPIKIKDQEMKFVKRQEKIYLKVIFTKSKDEEYIVAKSGAPLMPGSWKEALGMYKPVPVVYSCTDCPINDPKDLKMRLKVKNGFLVIETFSKKPGLGGELYLEVLDNKMAVGGGIGRGTGETVRILDNGNLYYSGFEFKKSK